MTRDARSRDERRRVTVEEGEWSEYTGLGKLIAKPTAGSTRRSAPRAPCSTATTSGSRVIADSGSPRRPRQSRVERSPPRRRPRLGHRERSCSCTSIAWRSSVPYRRAVVSHRARRWFAEPPSPVTPDRAALRHAGAAGSPCARRNGRNKGPKSVPLNPSYNRSDAILQGHSMRSEEAPVRTARVQEAKAPAGGVNGAQSRIRRRGASRVSGAELARAPLLDAKAA